MPKKKLTKLDGLFTFALTTGLFLAIQIHTGMDVSETGIGLTIIETLSKSIGNPFPQLISILSIVFMLTNGIVVTHHVKKATEHRYRGAIVSGGGFFGMLSLMLGSLADIDFITFLGVALCFIGASISGASRKI